MTTDHDPIIKVEYRFHVSLENARMRSEVEHRVHVAIDMIHEYLENHHNGSEVVGDYVLVEKNVAVAGWPQSDPED